MNYNKSQQQAIRHKDGPMLVLAGPGSGKTAVITQRTKQLIEYENIDPSNILVITFTGTADMTATGDLSSVAAATATAKSTGGDDLNLDLITK